MLIINVSGNPKCASYLHILVDSAQHILCRSTDLHESTITGTDIGAINIVVGSYGGGSTRSGLVLFRINSPIPARVPATLASSCIESLWGSRRSNCILSPRSPFFFFFCSSDRTRHAQLALNSSASSSSLSPGHVVWIDPRHID